MGSNFKKIRDSLIALNYASSHSEMLTSWYGLTLMHAKENNNQQLNTMHKLERAFAESVEQFVENMNQLIRKYRLDSLNRYFTYSRITGEELVGEKTIREIFDSITVEDSLLLINLDNLMESFFTQLRHVYERYVEAMGGKKSRKNNLKRHKTRKH